MKINVKVVYAFSSNNKGGNPAGVVIDANKLSKKQMLQISSKLGFSESVFIQHSNKANFKFSFFSPTQEVDLCGHAIIAAFHSLIHTNKVFLGKPKSKIFTYETNKGILYAECYKNGLIFTNQLGPNFYLVEKNRFLISGLLGIEEKDLMDYPIQTVSTGVPKLIVPVKSLKILFGIKPDLEGIKNYCKKMKVKGFYPFTFETIDKSDFHTRQFNPLAGINEDPITGVAAGALASYVLKYNLSNKKKFIIEQGYIMDKPGKIYVEVSNNIVKVGGYAYIFGEKYLSIKP